MLAAAVQGEFDEAGPGYGHLFLDRRTPAGGVGDRNVVLTSDGDGVDNGRQCLVAGLGLGFHVAVEIFIGLACAALARSRSACSGLLQCLLVDGGILLADNENRPPFPQVKCADFRPFLRCMLGARPPS